MVRLIRTCGGTRNGDSLGYACGILHIGKTPKERAPRKPYRKPKGGRKGKLPKGMGEPTGKGK